MSKGKKRKQKSPDKVTAVLGVAWYSRYQWERLRQIAADPENLDDTYEEWKASAKKALRDMEKLGTVTRKVNIDVEELVAWCKFQNLPIDGTARSAFAGEKLHEELKESE
jgi:hypothetical protein